MILKALTRKLSASLSVLITDVDPEKAIHIDLLVALEVRFWFMKEIRANLRSLDIMRWFVFFSPSVPKLMILEEDVEEQEQTLLLRLKVTPVSILRSLR